MIKINKTPQKFPLPTFVQDALTGKVWKFGWVDKETLDLITENEELWLAAEAGDKAKAVKNAKGTTFRVLDGAIQEEGKSLLLRVKLKPGMWRETEFAGLPPRDFMFLHQLETIIKQRRLYPDGKSYTSKLFSKGINKIAQKVGEEAVELVIEAKDHNISLLKNECADLLFHVLVLLEAKGTRLGEVVEILSERHKL